MSNSESQKFAELVAQFMDKMDDEQREKFFNHLRSEFCIHCGRETKHNVCHCTNDE